MGTPSILYDLASRRFLLLEPEWTVGKVLNLLVALGPEYVLLASLDEAEPGSRSFHGATAFEIELNLSRVSEDDRLDQIPDLLQKLDHLPTCDAYLPAHRAPGYCVVVDEEDVVGVWDEDNNLGPWRSGEEGLHRLEVDHEQDVDLGSELSLFVSLETDHFQDPESLVLNVPVGSEIEVWVRPKRGFRIVGPRSARLRVEALDRNDSKTFRSSATVFRLRATQAGVGRVELRAFFKGLSLGRLIVAPRVHDPEEPRDNGWHTTCRSEATASALLRGVPEGSPDLTLTIHEIGEGDDQEFEFRFHSPRFQEETFGPFRLMEDPQPQLQRLFDDLEDGGGFQYEDSIRRRVNQTGAYIFQRLLPEPLQHRIWSQRKQIKTVQILSDEVSIPWELCLLCGPENGRTVEDEVFCEAFALTRWWSGAESTRELPVCKIGVIVPSDSGLPDAEEEARLLLGRATPECPVERLPDSYCDLVQAFDRGAYGALHFTGHGVAFTDTGDWASIDLRRGESLRPVDLNGIASNLGLAHPVVFLNACRTGYGGQALSGIGGWATQFLRVGASAFIGTLWSVRTRPARLFAETFYEALFDGKTIASAAQQARCTVRDRYPNKTTWLAYTVYADPLAKVVPREPVYCSS